VQGRRQRQRHEHESKAGGSGRALAGELGKDALEGATGAMHEYIGSRPRDVHDRSDLLGRQTVQVLEHEGSAVAVAQLPQRCLNEGYGLCLGEAVDR
jgi:hypothetical protein